MNDNFKNSFDYLMSLSNRELKKEIKNSNWNFILQELRYAGKKINQLEEENYMLIDEIKCNLKSISRTLNILSKFEEYLTDMFNKTHDTRYLDDLMKLQKLLEDA